MCRLLSKLGISARISATTCAVLLGWNAVAPEPTEASCESPTPKVIWSYPAADDVDVPLDADLLMVTEGIWGDVQVTLDGEPLVAGSEFLGHFELGALEPSTTYRPDPDRARSLLAEAGHPDGLDFEKVSDGPHWTKGDLLRQWRVKLELFERFGVLPGAGDRHLAEFFPNFLTEESGWGARWGVGLTTICPGVVDTNIVNTTRFDAPPDQAEAARTRARKLYTARRYGPEKVAKAIVSAVKQDEPIRPVTPEAHLLYAVSRALPQVLRSTARGRVV